MKEKELMIIDNELRANYPDSPFDVIKQELLKDETAVIVTLKQYRALLEYRLKHYRPKKAIKKKAIRTEILPDWFVDAKDYYK
jgi:hypothetical protein